MHLSPWLTTCSLCMSSFMNEVNGVESVFHLMELEFGVGF